MTKVVFTHPDGQIFVAVGLDYEISDLRSLDILRRQDPMPTIYELIAPPDLNRRQLVKDFRLLRDQVGHALAQAQVQVMPEHDVFEGDHLRGIHNSIVEGSLRRGKSPNGDSTWLASMNIRKVLTPIWRTLRVV